MLEDENFDEAETMSNADELTRTEPRVNVLSNEGSLLGHVESGVASVVMLHGLGPTRQQSSDFRWKVEVCEADADGNPLKVLLRNDWHPQKAVDGTLAVRGSNLFSGWSDAHYWDVLPLRQGHVSPVFLRNLGSREFLGISDVTGNLEMRDDPVANARWSLLPAKGAYTRVQAIMGALFVNPLPFHAPLAEHRSVGPIADAYSTFASGSDTSEQTVEGEKIVFAKHDARCLFVYPKMKNLAAPPPMARSLLVNSGPEDTPKVRPSKKI
uniref:Uncharacterized protein n=1 Tax=Coccolithus braarudii TaxID=221442 RepID=A0A7S0L1T9_9EUKA|mmetsp:Transcript_10594/g.23038  ORF Transcript_10594/g.23038 Transcript_10594/m.23038 type:complete len:268 (+) Transcript_10594:23-826(+)